MATAIPPTRVRAFAVNTPLLVATPTDATALLPPNVSRAFVIALQALASQTAMFLEAPTLTTTDASALTTPNAPVLTACRIAANLLAMIQQTHLLCSPTSATALNQQNASRATASPTPASHPAPLPLLLLS